MGGWLKVECPKCKRKNSATAKTCTGDLLECPQCGEQYSPKTKTCPRCKHPNNPKVKIKVPCRFNLAKFSGRVYWIEYYDLEGKRRAERIGPNKTAAEQRLRELLSAKAEGRHIKKSPDAHTRFKALAAWYLTLDKVKVKQSYDRDKRSVGKLCAFFGDRFLKDITPALVEKYQSLRKIELSYRGHPTKPATVNREIACLKTIFNRAIANGKAERYPLKKVAMLPEDNERDRVLSQGEYDRLIAECPSHIKPVVKLAYYTGMRRGEILNLTWDRVDLRRGSIQLLPGFTDDGGTKTREGRTIPLHPELVEMFKAMPQGLPGVPVFNRQGKPITGSTIRVGLDIACKRARIEGFTFHDLRHTFTTNLRRAGVHDLVIMAITGHKTPVMFKRYNSISEDELNAAAEKIGSRGDLYGDHGSLETRKGAAGNG